MHWDRAETSPAVKPAQYVVDVQGDRDQFFEDLRKGQDNDDYPTHEAAFQPAYAPFERGLLGHAGRAGGFVPLQGTRVCLMPPRLRQAGSQPRCRATLMPSSGSAIHFRLPPWWM